MVAGRISGSIRSAAWGRGELPPLGRHARLHPVSIRSAAWGRGEHITTSQGDWVILFQSAPRLGAAENCLALTLGTIRANTSFSANRLSPASGAGAVLWPVTKNSSLFKELTPFAKGRCFHVHLRFAEGIIPRFCPPIEKRHGASGGMSAVTPEWPSQHRQTTLPHILSPKLHLAGHPLNTRPFSLCALHASNIFRFVSR